MKKTQYYLRERRYINSNGNINNILKTKKWARLLKKETFYKLLELNPKIIQYLNENEWKSDESTKNLPFHDNSLQPATNDISYVSSFIENHQNSYSGLYFEYLLNGYILLEDKVSEESKSFFLDVRNYFLEDTLSTIHNMSIRCIIQENWKTNGNYDIAQVFSPKVRKNFWDFYPVLERSVIECVYNKVCFYHQMLQHLVKDKNDIVDRFFLGKNFHHISMIQYNISDRHRAGSQTLCISLDNQKTILYKPHSLLLDQTFYSLINRLGHLHKINFYSPKIIERENYGWEEYICQLSCKSENEIKRYYVRIGFILFTSWLLGSSDLHYENLIAHREFPVIIDFECLFTPARTNNMNNLDYWIRNDSVLSTGILPIYHWTNDDKGVDLSALMGGQQKNTIFKTPVVKNYGKKDMHVTYDYLDFPPGKNKAMLNNQFLSPSLFETEIITGFKLAHNSFVSQKEDFTSILKSLQYIPCRYLLSDTQKYHLLLQSSFHPSLLKDAPDRELILYYLWNGHDFKSITDRRVVEAEINDLLNADIPYFYFYPKETALYDSMGNRIEKFFCSRPLDQLEKKVASLSLELIEFQIRLIHFSLNAFGKEVIPNKIIKLRNMIEDSNKYTKSQMLSYAKTIADKLLTEAIEYQSNISWIRIIMFDKKPGAVKISTSGMYLYDGISGINLFFHLLCKISPENQYIQFRNKLDNILFNYTDTTLKNFKMKESSNSGILNGEASLIFAYELYYIITHDPIYIRYAEKHVSILMRNAFNDTKYDLTDGISGAIISLLFLYNIGNQDVYQEMAEALSIKLLSESIEMPDGIGWTSALCTAPLTGAAHGNAGIILPLALLYGATGKSEYYLFLKKALKYEHNCFDATTGDWKDFRKEMDLTNTSNSYASWCHGAGGILFFRLLIRHLQWDNETEKYIREDIQRAAVYLLNHLNRPELCLCHGECGNRLIEKYFKHMQICLNSNMINNPLSNEKYVLTKEWYNPSLMNGYSGIGLYFLLLCIWDDLIG